MSSTYFNDWLSDVFKPCTLVFSTEKAKQIISKNNLSPADFLRPFGDFRGKRITITFNEKEKEIITMNNFSIDFYDSYKFKSIEKDTIVSYITKMFEKNEQIWDLNSPLITKKHTEPFKSKLKNYSTSWFSEFEKTLIECLRFDEFELYSRFFFYSYF